MLNKLIETAIYVHIPFCNHKCIYCDFYSIIKNYDADKFIESLILEIDYFAKIHSANRIIKTIYFGGGTPSILTSGQIRRIILKIKKNFNLSSNAEITLETNPGTVNKNKLSELKEAGVNRLSIGVQTFNERELKFLTRIHDSDQAIKTIINASETGFTNISADLIFNLPNQTKEIWKENLEQVVNLPVTHISTYSLILERGTILNKMVLDGKVKISGEDFDADLYEHTIDFLGSKGFMQYEVSNFAKPGYECLHNQYYWHYNDYIGFGPSSHSFINNVRWWNFSALNFYLRNIASKGNAIRSSEKLNSTEMQEEYVMLALRSEGLNLTEMENRFGGQWFVKNHGFISDLESQKLINISSNFINFTKSGYLLCDEILLKFEY